MSEFERLNHQAFLATRGLHLEPMRAIADLLRSSEAIDPVVRSSIADLFEGKGLGDPPVSLVMQKHDAARAIVEGIEARRQLLAIGRELVQRIEGGIYTSRKVAIEAAEDMRSLFGTLRGASSKHLDGAINMYNRYLRWRERGEYSGPNSPDPIAQEFLYELAFIRCEIERDQKKRQKAPNTDQTE